MSIINISINICYIDLHLKKTNKVIKNPFRRKEEEFFVVIFQKNYCPIFKTKEIISFRQTSLGCFESIPIFFVSLIPVKVLIVQQSRNYINCRTSLCGSWYCNTNVIKIILEELWRHKNINNQSIDSLLHWPQ